MWGEAFRSVEDIQALIALAKKVPKPALMATYYATLTQIFAVSENHLYHAYAWLKLLSFTKSYNKSLTAVRAPGGRLGCFGSREEGAGACLCSGWL